MLRHIASVAGLTLASRVLGFLRDMVTAAYLGAGPIADAFFIAFRLPNHFRALFAEGAFTAAFAPSFARVRSERGQDAALRFAEQVGSWLLLSQVLLLALVLAATPAFMTLFAPGLDKLDPRAPSALQFTRICFPYLLFIALVSLYSSVLNALGRYAAGAAAAIVMNLVLIAAQIILTPLAPNAGYALSWGVFAAGVAQFLFLLWACVQAGWAPKLPLPRRHDPHVRRFLTLLGPALLGSGMVQISLFADTLIASLLPVGAVSHLYYADRLNQLPLGVIGVAIGTVLLPEMSRLLRDGQEAEAQSAQNRALELGLLFSLPSAAILALCAEPMLAALFGRGRFTAADAAGSGLVLTAYALGLPAFIALRGLTPGFHAREDTRTPVRVALAAMLANVGLKIALMGPLGAAGLAAATSVGAWINAAALAGLLRSQGHLTLDALARRRLPAIVAATLAMIAAMAAVRWGLAPLLPKPQGEGGRIAALAMLLWAGGFAFLAVAWPTGLLRLFMDLRRRRRKKA